MNYKTSAKLKSIEQDDSLLEYADLRGLKLIKYNKTTKVFAGKMKIFKPYVNVQVCFILLHAKFSEFR